MMHRLPLLLVALALLAGCSARETDESSSAAASEQAAAAEAPQKMTPAPPVENRSVGARLDDAALAAQVKMALVEEQSLRPFELDPAAQGRRVTLRGDVSTRAQYDHAAEVARSVEGVGAVVNELTIEGRPVVAETPESASGNVAGTRAPSGGGAGVYHTVQSGESLWVIARRNDTSPEQIRRLNGLRSNTVKPGQRLLVRRTGAAPAPSTSASEEKTAAASDSEPEASYHTVRSGESLWIIARRSGTSVERIKRLNDLRSNTVKPGQRLRVD